MRVASGDQMGDALGRFGLVDRVGIWNCVGGGVGSPMKAPSAWGIFVMQGGRVVVFLAGWDEGTHGRWFWVDECAGGETGWGGGPS